MKNDLEIISALGFEDSRFSVGFSLSKRRFELRFEGAADGVSRGYASGELVLEGWRELRIEKGRGPSRRRVELTSDEVIEPDFVFAHETWADRFRFSGITNEPEDIYWEFMGLQDVDVSVHDRWLREDGKKKHLSSMMEPDKRVCGKLRAILLVPELSSTQLYFDYAQRCWRDSLQQGESGLCPVPLQRNLLPPHENESLEDALTRANDAWIESADAIVTYTDFGETDRMRELNRTLDANVRRFRRLFDLEEARTFALEYSDDV